MSSDDAGVAQGQAWTFHAVRHGQEDACSVFQPFFRVESQGPGTGLGLAVVDAPGPRVVWELPEVSLEGVPRYFDFMG